MLLRPKAETNSTFMTWAMNSPSFYNRVALGQIATTSPHVNVRDIKKALVVRPQPPEQLLIGEALATDDSDRAKLESCVEKLRRLKSGLMNDLLTGRVPIAPLLPNSATLISR
jgi:type I restriction enzyme S subunit